MFELKCRDRSRGIFVAFHYEVDRKSRDNTIVRRKVQLSTIL